MKPAHKKKIYWLIIILGIFGFFRWLFGIAVPKAAFSFSVGVTVILVAGLFSGRYVAKAWLITDRKTFSRSIALLSGLFLTCITLIGFFISKMIRHTEFSFFLFTIVCLFLMSVSTAAMITIISNRQKENIRLTEMALTHSKSELQLLQSQLSPHFLFNTLNNLYGLAITDHKRVPGLLLKLSDLLRYTIYEVKDVFVPLADEIRYLTNYIEFEQIRLGERLSLSTSFPEVINTPVAIAPMLLVIFIENAFKHSKNNSDKKVEIRVKLEVIAHQIFFSISNSFDAKQPASELNSRHSGFGLKSVRTRLDLLYKNRHSLSISTANNLFNVSLVLQTDEDQMHHSR